MVKVAGRTGSTHTNLPSGAVTVIVRGPDKFEVKRDITLPLPRGEEQVIDVP